MDHKLSTIQYLTGSCQKLVVESCNDVATITNLEYSMFFKQNMEYSRFEIVATFHVFKQKIIYNQTAEQYNKGSYK